MNDTLLNKASEYVVGSSVYVYVAPEITSEPEASPIWNCTIQYVEATRKITVYDDAVSEDIEVKLHLGCGFDNFTKTSKDVFVDFEQAKAYGLRRLEELNVTRDEYQCKLQVAMENLVKQSPDVE